MRKHEIEHLFLCYSVAFLYFCTHIPNIHKKRIHNYVNTQTYQ